MSANLPASPDSIDILSLWGAFRRSLKALILFALCAGAVTYMALYSMAPQYVSQAELAIVAKGANNPFADPRGGRDGVIATRVDKEAINTHVRALMSPDLAVAISKKFKLEDRREFNGRLGPADRYAAVMRMLGFGKPNPRESDQDRVLSAFFQRLNVYSAKNSRFIAIQFTSSDAKLAADVANAIADIYRHKLADRVIAETGDVTTALEPKIGKLTEEVARADAAAGRFRAEKGLLRSGAQKTLLDDQRLSDLNKELSKISEVRAEAESRARSARALVRAGSAEASPAVQKSPLIQNLVQQRVRVERQISELSATLLPRHPRMRQLSADLYGLKKQIRQEVAKVITSLDKEAQAQALRETDVRRRIAQIKQVVAGTNEDEVKARGLEAFAKSKRAELERLRAQYEANKARADSGAVPVEAQIITRARASSVPSFPKKGPYAALIAFAAWLFGSALVLTKALLAGARSSSGGGSAYAPAPVEASQVPAQPAAAVSVADGPGSAEPGLVMRSAGALGDYLRMLAGNKGGFRSLVSSESSSLDASEDGLSIAKAMAAKGEQVVVVDWALDGSGAIKAHEGTTDKGIRELLLGQAGFEEIVGRLPRTSVDVIGAGGAFANAGRDIDPDLLNLVLDALDEAYDHIVVVARRDDAKVLFEKIQGRFDAGITVCEPRGRVRAIQDPRGTFLGFEVQDITLVRFERRVGALGVVSRFRRNATSRESGDEART